MKIKPVILRTNSSDSFLPATPEGCEPVRVDFTQHDRKLALLHHKVYQFIDPTRLTGTVQDLLNLALMAYTIDQTVSREQHGYLNWSRHFQCFVPVSTPQKWVPIRDDLQRMFTFLSGDHWEFIFREGIAETPTPPNHTYNLPGQVTKVSLFSGGLDSFIGAIDQLHDNQHLAFISHYKAGGVERKAQETLVNVLRSQYDQQLIVHYPFYVQPNQSAPGVEKEISSRARSLLFIGLGVAMANCLGNVPLIIPENGFISLNVPLTPTRQGSHSTRTTHPYFLHLFQQILRQLDIPIQLDNPYQFSTKGEMVKFCANQALLKAHFKTTLSCAHPDQARFKKLPPGTHCGYCTPCIIRRASLEAKELLRWSMAYM